MSQQRITIAILCALIALSLSCQKAKTHHISIDLLKEIQDAEFVWDTHRIDFGSPAIGDSLVRGWQRNDPRNPRSSIVSQPPRAVLLFHCFTISDRTVSFRARPLNDMRRALTIYVNGTALAKEKIGTGLRTYSLKIPANVLHRGDNFLGFFSSGSIEFDSVSFLETHHADDSRMFSTSARMPASHAIQFYLRVPENASLDCVYSLLKNQSEPGAASRIVISIQPDGEKATELIHDTVRNRWFFRASGSREISLAPFANKIARLTLQAESLSNETALIAWPKIRLNLPSIEKHPAVPYQKVSFHPETRPNVIIYLIDALRGDHLQPYGYPKPVSPFINEFTKDAVVFENAYSHVSWTRPSVATILTGLYPSTHQIQDRLDVLSQQVPTLPAVLKRFGYHTYGFVTQPNVSAQFGFGRKYDRYDEIYPSTDNHGHVQSDLLVQTATEILRDKSINRTFLYIHAVDTHAPLTPLDRFLRPTNCNWKDPKIYYPQMNASDVSVASTACTIALYDAAVRESDYYFGQFLQFLKQKNAYDNSLIIVTGDHGESFLEHGHWGHGSGLYQNELRVPLIIKFPMNRFGGKRVHAVARHIDVVPTVLDCLGLDHQMEVQGETLLSLLVSESQNRIVFSELALDRLNRRALFSYPYKLIETQSSNSSENSYELYDLKTDPQEHSDIQEQRTVLFGYFKMVLHQWERDQKKKALQLGKPKTAILDKETEEQLKALGYLQ